LIPIFFLVLCTVLWAQLWVRIYTNAPDGLFNAADREVAANLYSFICWWLPGRMKKNFLGCPELRNTLFFCGTGAPLTPCSKMPHPLTEIYKGCEVPKGRVVPVFAPIVECQIAVAKFGEESRNHNRRRLRSFAWGISNLSSIGEKYVTHVQVWGMRPRLSTCKLQKAPKTKCLVSPGRH
jgi:hypothetical protein